MGIQLSYSATQKYMNSPLSFFLHYYLKLRPIETGSALAFGSAVDSGLNALLTDLRDGREPSLDRAKAMFDTDFGRFKATEIKYSKADLDADILTSDDLNFLAANPNIPTSYFSLIRKGHMILAAYQEQVLPMLEKVILVQHQISLSNEYGDTLIGVVDLVAQIGGKVYVLDNKTSSIKYADDAANVSQQLATYYEALKTEYKIDGVGFIVIPKHIRKRKEPKVPIELKFGSISDDVLAETFSLYEKVLDGIKQGEFKCSGCNENPWPCPYRTFCESGGKDLTGLRYEEKTK